MDYRNLYERTPIHRLFVIVALPSTVSMLVSSLYQILDGAFVGHILGAEAFAAINLVMPLVILNFSLADLVGVGSSVPIALRLGEKDERAASNLFSSACLLIVLLGVAIGGALFFLAEPLLRLMGAEAPLVEGAARYLRVYAASAPLTTIVFAVDNYLRICGKVHFSMVVNILMSIISICLEFLFLYVFRWGIGSAALATCSGMFLCALIALWPFWRGRLPLRFTRPKLDRETLRSILANGAPSFLNNMAGRIPSIAINILLLRLGGAPAVAAYGVLMYVDSIFQPILYGLCDSVQPAIGYNCGAGNYLRVDAIRRHCFAICGALSALMCLALFRARDGLVALFVQTEEAALLALSAQALTLFAFAYLTRWVAMVAQSYLSALGKAGAATLLSLSVALIFPLMALAALRPLGLNGIWLNMPVSCLLAAVLSVALLHATRRRAPACPQAVEPKVAADPE